MTSRRSEKPVAESPSEREVRAFLEQTTGLRVTKIPTRNVRTADYYVDGDQPPYLVEVKSRLPSAQITELAPGASVFLEHDLRHDDRVGDWLASARSQMRSLDPEHARLWILWALAESTFDADAQVARIVSSLYGYRRAVVTTPPHRSVGCYYAGRAAFDRFPDIDAVITYRMHANDVDVGVHLNEASERLSQVLNCQIVKAICGNGPPPTAPSHHPPLDDVVVPRGLLASGGEDAVLAHLTAALGGARIRFWSHEKQFVGAVRMKKE